MADYRFKYKYYANILAEGVVEANSLKEATKKLKKGEVIQEYSEEISFYGHEPLELFSVDEILTDECGKIEKPKMYDLIDEFADIVVDSFKTLEEAKEAMEYDCDEFFPREFYVRCPDGECIYND